MFGLSSIKAINAAWATAQKKKAASAQQAKNAEKRARRAEAVRKGRNGAAVNRYLQDNDQ